MRYIEVPSEFQPNFTGAPYPPHQRTNLIERRCADYFCADSTEINSEYIYLPILWTSYHVNNGYGANASILQEFVDDVIEQFPNEKFFTTVQYAGGTLTSIPNSKIFGCSGTNYCLFNAPNNYSYGERVKHDTSEYIPIPLKCDDHIVTGDNMRYKVGFVGRLFTHPCRYDIYNKLKDIDCYYIHDGDKIPDSGKLFREITANSIFTLTPRGYGPTSFRLLESMQLGSIPIYVGDNHWLPFSDEIDWKKICVIVNDNNIDTIPSIVDTLIDSGEYLKMRKNITQYYNKYFSWDGIIKNIEKRISKV
tara:strand:+ start:2495 stop:3412 length:918 start_codon:yes stop_codon:yes gene_type:complete